MEVQDRTAFSGPAHVRFRNTVSMASRARPYGSCYKIEDSFLKFDFVARAILARGRGMQDLGIA